MADQRPRGRRRGEIQNGGGVNVGGSVGGNGPVGSSDGYQGRKESAQSSGGRTGGTRGGGGINPLVIIIIAVILLAGGGGSGLLGGLFGGGTSSNVSTTHDYAGTYGTGHSVYGTGQSSQGTGQSSQGTGQSTQGTGQSAQGTGQSSQGTGQSNAGSSGNALSAYFNQLYEDPSTYTGEPVTSGTTSQGTPDQQVASAARAKRTKIYGGGRDSVTIMIYMCGTDLESRSGMATSDLSEMAQADLGNLNVIVYTGGCLSWRNNIVSSRVNQIYQVRNGGISCLVENAGTGSMTDPSTLASFVKWCGDNFPANRNELIFWDHGGGSVSGYGYDEKNQRSGAMSLAGIDRALEAAGVTFDFIGFDACLMATAENAIMLDSYGDYLIASEQTEPGIGWYYTNWLTKLARNTSMPTIEIGKSIADDFVTACHRYCPGQQTTLSVTDLAEFSATVPPALSKFAGTISDLISTSSYQVVSRARSMSREFASETRIDQVDLIDLAQNMGNTEGQNLISAISGAVKYNLTNNISHAYGLSIFFPYKSLRSVDSAVNTYNAIGMDSAYTKCIQEFASLETAGQAAMGGTQSPLGSLFGTDSYSSYGSSDLIGQLLGSFLGGDLSSLYGLDSGNTGYLFGRSLSDEDTVKYITEHHFDPSQLKWEKSGDQMVLSLSDDQWAYVDEMDLNLFYDTGRGYADLGLDNVYSYDKQGRLVADTSRAWLGINGQIVAYYRLSTEDDGENYRVTGRIPALLNDEYVNLFVVFDNDHPGGYVTGASVVYKNGETDTVPKNLTEIVDGDRIQFICDMYSYNEEYMDSVTLGDEITVDGELEVMDLDIGSGEARITYRFTDIYNNQFWTPAITE